jgi:hypothetical protein
MTTQTLPSGAVAEGGSMRRVSGRLKSLWVSLVTWVETCAEYRAAAAIYEQLSALSDAELARRGLSRATLARDVLDGEITPLRDRRSRTFNSGVSAAFASDCDGCHARWRRSIL